MTLIRALIFSLVLVLILAPIPAYAGNQCIVDGANAAAAALDPLDWSELRKLSRTYFGEELAKLGVGGNKWGKMNKEEQKKQIKHTREVVIALSRELATYAGATFKWKDDGIHAFVTLKDGTTRNVTIIMSGKGCEIADIRSPGFPNLSRLVGDYRKRGKEEGGKR